ncbi:MAG: LLM class flavin-dependent oxidoreductase [Janthinobacterium lividum]
MLDVLSGGRLVLGFGLGDDGAVGELSCFGEVTDAKTRAAVLDEGLDVIAGLLSGSRVTHEGTHVTARTSRPCRPPPGPAASRSGPPPVALPRADARAARWDGLLVIATEGPDDARGLVRPSTCCGRTSVAGTSPWTSWSGSSRVTRSWADAGATWVLTQVGPHELDLDAVREVVRTGP